MDGFAVSDKVFLITSNLADIFTFKLSLFSFPLILVPLCTTCCLATQ